MELPKYNQYGLTFKGYPTKNCATCYWKSNCNGSPCGVKTIKKASDASLQSSSKGIGLSTTSGSASGKKSLTEPLPIGEKKPMSPTILSLLRYQGGYWICTDGMKYIEQLPAYIHQSQIGYNFQGSVEKPVKPSPSPSPEPEPKPEPIHRGYGFNFDKMLDRNYKYQLSIPSIKFLI